jgi:hypothetical protein
MSTDFAALRSVAFGTKRQIAILIADGRFRAEADVQGRRASTGATRSAFKCRRSQGRALRMLLYVRVHVVPRLRA